MTKKVIAIVSVLKPVDDTRNYEKLARSIGNTNKYEINIIGFSAINIPLTPNIRSYPIFDFKRSGTKRLFASAKIFKLLLKLKPELIIVTTPELLMVSILNKILFGSRIIYDVQENYFRNIIYTETYPILMRYPAAVLIRAVEYLSYPFVDRYLVAEKVYIRQLPFLSDKYILLENKALSAKPKQKTPITTKSRNLKFVYTGTIAEHYGIFDAIEFTKQLKTKFNNLTLTIIGYAAQDTTYKKLIRHTEGLDFIKIIGGNTLVPHDQILNEMNTADFCLLPYQANKSTAGRIPTKLYECLAMELPIIIASNAAWNDLVKQNNAGIIHEFNSDTVLSIEQLERSFYGNNLSADYTWKHSGPLLLEAIAGTIK